MHENESSLTERNRKNNFFNNPNVILIQLLQKIKGRRPKKKSKKQDFGPLSVDP